MSWHITLLFVHTFALFALVALYRHCPDLLQRVVLVLLMFSSLVLFAAAAAAIAGVRTHWMVSRLGYEIEHIAVLLYLFRLFINDQERRCLPSSSEPFPSSQR